MRLKSFRTKKYKHFRSETYQNTFETFVALIFSKLLFFTLRVLYTIIQ